MGVALSSSQLGCKTKPRCTTTATTSPISWSCSPSAMVGGQNALLFRISRGLALLHQSSPRLLTIPPAQPPLQLSHRVRRASVAIILRVRPSVEDERWLAEQYATDGRPLPGADAAAMTQQLSQFPSSSPNDSTSRNQPGSPIAAPSHILPTFFSLPWVQRGTPELYFIERAKRVGDNWSGQVAFPGGRKEDSDVDGLETATRETWEECGINLASSDFLCLGQLDDREITSSLGQKFLMILSPYVFLQLGPFSPASTLVASEVASAQWTPVSLLESPEAGTWSTTTVDMTKRIAPSSTILQWFLKVVLGDMKYCCIYLPNRPMAVATEADAKPSSESPATTATSDRDDVSLSSEDTASRQGDAPDYSVAALAHPQHVSTTTTLTPTTSPAPILKDRPPLCLWGLTLVMTLEFLSRIPPASVPTPTTTHFTKPRTLTHWIANSVNVHRPYAPWRQTPIFAAAFPAFTHIDLNTWIWVFGWNYRRLAASWAEQIASIGPDAQAAWERICDSTNQPLDPASDQPSLNYAELAIRAYYSAVRRAVVLTIFLRGLGVVLLSSTTLWLILR